MKRALFLISLAVLLLVDGRVSAQTFKQYCSTPPYASRAIIANIVILMDNSQDMLVSAYTNTYSENSTKNNYIGYFNPQGCYTYTNNAFQEVFKYENGKYRSYKWEGSGGVNEACPSTAPSSLTEGSGGWRPNNNWSSFTASSGLFRGNLLNWATMSKYDILQKVIVGGNTVSKQSNANSLLSISGSWTKTYNGCVFQVASGNLTITEDTLDTCALIKSTPLPIAFWDRPAVKSIVAWFGKSYRTVLAAAAEIKNVVAAASIWLWEKIEFIRNAYAAQLTITPQTSWSGTVGVLYSFTLEGGGTNNATYNWSFSPSPPASWFTQEIKGDYIGNDDGLCDAGEACTPTYASQGNRTDYRVTYTGMPISAGTYTFSVTVSASGHTSATQTYGITIAVAPLQMLTTGLPIAETSEVYNFALDAQGGLPWFSGGVPYYSWSTQWCSGAGCTNFSSGLPGSFSLSANGSPSAGVISSTNVSGVGTYTIRVTVTDSSGTTATNNFQLIVQNTLAKNVHLKQYDVKINMMEEPFTDTNGNDIWDSGEPFTTDNDKNGNGVWDGKEGVFQEFWDVNDPRARWGMAKFRVQGQTVNADLSNVSVDIDACVPASPASSFFTRIQNATPVPTNGSPLAKGLYGVINYYANTNVGTAFEGCTNSDPIDSAVPCRKNFVLIISSGSNLDGTHYTQTDCTGLPYGNNAAPLVQNACYGYKTDLRPPISGVDTYPNKQNMYTYIVNTMGMNATNNQIMEDAAKAGGGKYYPADNASNLQAQLVKAMQDILAQAASGTAVSVLTTSSRGVGSVVQAYFLPTRQEREETRDVEWTGYMQNIWIDNIDNLRDDSGGSSPPDYTLKLAEDKVMKLYYNEQKSQTEAGLFTTDADGTGGTLASCLTTTSSNPPRIQFSEAATLWEAGKKLALRRPSDPSGESGTSGRKIFTSKKVLWNTTSGTTTYNFSNNEFTVTNIASNATLSTSLNADATFSADEIIKYARGECLEMNNYDTSTGDCPGAAGATLNSKFRDRRMKLYSSSTSSTLIPGANSQNGNVWKLGDIISSTPKVLATVPQNTYHTDYGDTTYYAFTSSSTYKNRSSVVFVGANDGMLHAFRVGYLKDQSDDQGTLASTVKAIFKNFKNTSDDAHNQLGEELWGYIPFNAFPYLKYLANTSYCHIYYADLSVKLMDASVGDPSDATFSPNDDRTASSWRTILIGGMRYGGACSNAPSGAWANPSPPLSWVGYSSFFAIDVTNVGTTATNPENEPVFLWEFSDEDIGYTSSFPAVVRTGAANKNGNWFLVLGSGSTRLPKDGQDLRRVTTGYLYVLDLKTGELKKKIDLGHNAIVSDILSVDADWNYHSERVYFGTSYCTTFQTDGGGNYTPAGICTGGWKGKLMRLNIPADLTSSTAGSWTPVVKTLLDSDYPLTASPDAAKDEMGKVWVYAGSGKYYSNMDEEDVAQQVFVGIKDKDDLDADPLVTIASTASRTEACPASCPASDLCNVTNCQTTGTPGATIKVCDYNKTNDVFEAKDVVTSITNASTSPKSDVGWLLFLAKTDANSEKMITRPLAVGGLVDFLTYLPTGSVCSYGGESFLYSVDYTSGTAPSTIAIKAPGATTQSGDQVRVEKKIKLGPGAPPTGEAIIIPPQKENKDELKKKIQIATGVIVEAVNNPIIKTDPKIIQWLKK